MIEIAFSAKDNTLELDLFKVVALRSNNVCTELRYWAPTPPAPPLPKKNTDRVSRRVNNYNLRMKLLAVADLQRHILGEHPLLTQFVSLSGEDPEFPRRTGRQIFKKNCMKLRNFWQ